MLSGRFVHFVLHLDGLKHLVESQRLQSRKGGQAEVIIYLSYIAYRKNEVEISWAGEQKSFCNLQTIKSQEECVGCSVGHMKRRLSDIIWKKTRYLSVASPATVGRKGGSPLPSPSDDQVSVHHVYGLDKDHRWELKIKNKIKTTKKYKPKPKKKSLLNPPTAY